MNEIKYITGDLFKAVSGVFGDEAPDVVIIPHCCNDIGRWGSGFVVPLGKTYPKAENSYREWFTLEDNKPRLGAVQLVNVSPGCLFLGTTPSFKKPQIVVGNMIGQHGVVGPDNPTPIDYQALEECISRISAYLRKGWGNRKVEIHAPKFGAGLAQGKWEKIEPIIQRHWQHWPVTIYSI